MQRNQMHRNACEDAAAQFMEITANPPLKVTTKHRHSVHSGTVPHLQVRMTHRNSSSTGSTERFELEPSEPTGGPQRSTSSDYCKVDKKHSISGTTRLLKWLGISDKQTTEQTEQAAKKPMSKRRMSTFT
ncbi:hypothetical protein GCK72_011827 [Caenorhabditis remanei]|uniref:Uncharacterized protein n=2 Tax=Caenorhabditis remanei TaxID=31234 RepID=A0A6A5H9Q6_CAERE|nr:hypothetical protein GCK72_011827 [Caenorhabditis remanei]KAF1763561.1 hypothetical protein GCK72_011827 [Caenorhabditis remanei]